MLASLSSLVNDGFFLRLLVPLAVDLKIPTQAAEKSGWIYGL
jgi:hypothetical protein